VMNKQVGKLYREFGGEEGGRDEKETKKKE
jgi:hypothetical protein